MPLDLSCLGGHVPGKPLRLFLSRRNSGLYMFTALCPRIEETCFSKQMEVWPEPGDEFFTQVCAGSAERLSGRRLDPLTSIRGRLVWIEDEH